MNIINILENFKHIKEIIVKGKMINETNGTKNRLLIQLNKLNS